MSGGNKEQLAELGKWRRSKHGVWKIIFIVEGYDEEFVHYFPGRLSQRFACKLAAHNLTFELKVRRCHIILKSIRKD